MLNRRGTRIAILVGLLLIPVGVALLSMQEVRGVCTVDGPCAHACETAWDACRAGCVLPDGRIDIPCVSNCAAELNACLNGCTTCP